MSKETGGPAFPVPADSVRDYGMDLRDYFAAKAMQSLRSDRDFLLKHDPDQVANRAYEIADAMLKARTAQ